MKKPIILLAALLILVNGYSQSSNFKRGISFGSPTIQVEDLETMSGHLSWYYNWGTSPEVQVEDELANYGIEYVPMTWNASFNEDKLRTYYTNHPEAKYLLGFNEPNFADQANMTPSVAAANWYKLEALADEFDLEIVGPAVNWCGNCVSEGGTTYSNPYEYLDDFFAVCPDCQVDYIAVHNYMCYSGPLISYLDDFKKYGKKIWLTEFACWDQNTITLDMQKDLMYGALDYLDNDTMIYRYSWFIGRSGDGTPHIDIFESEAGKLTELGELYLNFNPIHDTSIYNQIPGRIEAESYSDMSGIALQGTQDIDGIANIGWIDGGDWMEYNLDVPEAGDYYLYLRISANSSTSADLWLDDELAVSLSISSSSGWQNWKTISTPLSLNKGKSILKISTNTGNFNLNWIHILANENVVPTISAGEELRVELPQDTIFLAGTVDDPEGVELKYNWRRVSGPNCTIQSPDSLSTVVSGLTEGVYKFVLFVYDGFVEAEDDVIVRVVVPDNTFSDMDKAGNFTLYPNPVTNILRITLPASENSCFFEILNASGQVIYTSSDIDDTDHLEVDFRTFEDGIYFVKLQSSDKVTVRRVLKIAK